MSPHFLFDFVLSFMACLQARGNAIRANTQLQDRKERHMREGERERKTFKGKGELYNMPQYPTFPPKWPRSGITFHFTMHVNLLTFVTYLGYYFEKSEIL